HVLICVRVTCSVVRRGGSLVPYVSSRSATVLGWSPPGGRRRPARRGPPNGWRRRPPTPDRHCAAVVRSPVPRVSVHHVGADVAKTELGVETNRRGIAGLDEQHDVSDPAVA